VAASWLLDGGDVQRFDGGGAVDAARARRDAAQQTLYTYGLRQRRDDPQGFMAAQNEFNTAQQAVAAAEAAYSAEMSGTGTTRAAMGPQDVGATKQFSTLPAVAPAVVPPVAAAPGAPTLRFPPTAPPASSVKTPPVAGAGGPRPAPAPAPAPAAPAGLSYLDQLKAAQTAMGPTVNPEQVAMDALVAERNRGAADSKKELEADIASRADQFKNREERTNKRQTELDKSKDANTGMALLEAGLAMMQSRGPGLAGIAQGAGVGLKQYQSGIKDLKAAQEKLDEARDRTDELKQNQSMMDKSAVRAANKDIRDASLAGQQYQIDARMKIYGENRTDARAGIASDIARAESALDRQNRIQVAGIAAAPGLARNKMLAASQSDTAKARTEYGKLQAKVMSDLSADPQYTMATDAVKAQMATTRLRAALLNNPFLSAYAAGIGFSAAPAGTGAVHTLDED